MTDWQKPKLMGVLNITPDSFSDGGQFTSIEAALAQAEMLMVQGAQIIDVGGESTRPGADRVTLETEQGRVLPVIAAISQKFDVDISIDTMNSETARKAVEAGARIVNDISGGKQIRKCLAPFKILIASMCWATGEAIRTRWIRVLSILMSHARSWPS